VLGIAEHQDVFVLVELPFALNDVNLRLTVPVPTDYLHAEDAASSPEPSVHLSIANLGGVDALPAGGQGIRKFLADLGHDDLAAQVLEKMEAEGPSRTLVQAQTVSCRVAGEGDHPSDEAAVLDRTIYAINRFLHPYLIAFEEEEVHFIARQHVTSPVLLSPVGFGDSEFAQLVRVLGPPGHSLRYTPRSVRETDLSRLGNAIGIEPLDHPMDAARLWLIDARRAHATGEGDHAIVALQTSAERLLYGAHQLLLIDEGLNENELLARQLETPFRGLLAAQLPARLKGNWKLDGTGAVAQYWRDLYEARNAITHAGYRLHRQHVASAFVAYGRLEEHLINRSLALKAKYPRLAFGLLGAEGLRRRGMLTKKLAQWAEAIEAEDQPFWLPTLAPDPPS
jgi:hypothetical protein